MHNTDTVYQELLQYLGIELVDYDISALLYPDITQISNVIQFLIAQELENNHPCGDQV